MTIEELADRIPEVARYRSLWLGGMESGIFVWESKMKLADAALLACAAEIERVEGEQHDS